MKKDKAPVKKLGKPGTDKKLKAAGLALGLYPVLIFLYAGFGLYFPIEHYLFFLWLIMMFYLPVTPRVTSSIGLAFLGLCPLVLSFHGDDLANRLARIAFLFLALGGLKIIVSQYFFSPEKEDHAVGG